MTPPKAPKPLFVTDKARAAKGWVDGRLKELKRKRCSATHGARGFNPEYAVLSRISKFRFEDYPDYTAPWHILQWPYMRWEHVFYVCYIIEALKQAKGGAAGQAIHLLPFQAFIILCFLGPEDPNTGLRLIQEGLLTLARKNMKTTTVAGIVTALMVLEKAQHGLYGQEIYVGASDREQAGVTFDIVNKFILQDQTLGISDLFRSVPSRKHMTHSTTLTDFRVLSSDAYRAHGLNPAVVIFDEVGNVPAGAADEFYSVLTSGYGAQREPLTLLLSTQAPSDTHLFSQMVDRAKRVNQGDEEAPDFAGFVFETPEQLGGKPLDPHDERYWYLANPGLGVSPSRKDMRTASTKARALPSLESKFRNLRLNQRANPLSPLISKTLWQSCGVPVDVDALYGKRCWAALDLSSVRDLTAFVLVFEESADGRMPVLPFFWLPGVGLSAKETEDKVPYVMWSRQGFLDAESDRTIEYARVAGRIEQCLSDFDVQAIGCDRWRWNDLKAQLRDRGLGHLADDEEFLIPVGQGYKDATPCVEALERAVLNEQLAHGNHPVLTWNAANAVVEQDPAGNRKWSKAKAYGRIDGMVALSMALRIRELKDQFINDGPSAFESESCLM